MVTFPMSRLKVWTLVILSLGAATPAALLSTDNDSPAFTEFTDALRSQVTGQTENDYTDDEVKIPVKSAIKLM